MPQGAVLKFACSANNCTFAVAFYRLRAAKRCSQVLSHPNSKRLQVVHEAGNLLDIASGERVVNDGDHRPTSLRRLGRRATLVEDLLNREDMFSDCDFMHDLELAVRVPRN